MIPFFIPLVGVWDTFFEEAVKWGPPALILGVVCYFMYQHFTKVIDAKDKIIEVIKEEHKVEMAEVRAKFAKELTDQRESFVKSLATKDAIIKDKDDKLEAINKEWRDDSRENIKFFTEFQHLLDRVLDSQKNNETLVNTIQSSITILKDELIKKIDELKKQS